MGILSYKAHSLSDVRALHDRLKRLTPQGQRTVLSHAANLDLLKLPINNPADVIIAGQLFVTRKVQGLRGLGWVFATMPESTVERLTLHFANDVLNGRNEDIGTVGCLNQYQMDNFLDRVRFVKHMGTADETEVKSGAADAD